MKKNVWFITGASKGLGLSLTKKLIEDGYHVAATSRNIKELREAVDATPEYFLPLKVEITNENSVEAAIKETVNHFGSIDVVVNNAGYGQIGSLEELTDDESRENFNINVFGSLNVIRKAMPYLRAQKSGHIFNIASIGGFNGAFPGFGIYAATKFAVHGLSESLAPEVKPFGIHVTIVSPGYFRTNFLDSGSLRVPANAIAAYTVVRATQDLHQEGLNGNQAGDPEKAAQVMINVSNLDTPPLHLFLGEDAYSLAKAKIKSVQQDMKTIEHLATATAFS
jgi:NAD(P)-dependent dehydrogenase (short-subunit alcohol dehydrogenase family)